MANSNSNEYEFCSGINATVTAMENVLSNQDNQQQQQNVIGSDVTAGGVAVDGSGNNDDGGNIAATNVNNSNIMHMSTDSNVQTVNNIIKHSTNNNISNSNNSSSNINSKTPIKDFYKDATILITGGTGFVGKVLIQKLLRAFEVRKIYMLIRCKNNMSVEQRLKEYFNESVSKPDLVGVEGRI